MMTDDILGDEAANQDSETQGGKKRRRGLGRRKKDKGQAQQTGSGGSGGSSSGGGLRQWLVDTYNGVFRIVIMPQLPSWRVLGFMLAGLLFGLFWAYVIAPTQFYNAAPHQLRQEHQDQYVIGVAASAMARIYDDQGIATLLNRVDDPGERIERLKGRGNQIEAAMEEIDDIAANVNGTESPTGGSLLTDVLNIALAVVIFVALSWIIALAWGLLIGGYFERARNTVQRRVGGESEEDKAARATMETERKRRELQKQMEEEAKADAGSELGPPLLNKPSIYTKGRPYDDSFAIEDANDMFLGETGATIAKTIGDGQDLTAVEIWLFDKDDFVKTYTKIFVSEHAANDPAIMSDLENRVDDRDTDITILKQGATLELESNNLLVRAKVADLQPGSNGSLPQNSHFDGLTIQMQGWQKQAAAAAAGGGGKTAGAAGSSLPDVSEYEIGPPPDIPGSQGGGSSGQSGGRSGSGGLADVSEYEIGPPPDMPGSQGSGSSSSQGSSTQPSSFPPDDEDEDDDEDDPFGGTGDFTPIGR